MDWVVDFESKLGEMETSKVANDWKKRSIYKVYACSKDLNQKAYKPQAVAFGPYHYEDKQLQMQMDAHKRRALHHFLKNSGKPLKTYVTAMQSVVSELMASYDILDANWQEDTFLQLMLLDGCFMLEILRANDEIRKPEDTYGNYGGVADPIFSYHGKVYVMPYVRRDMLMLENQLPMLLLVTLVTIEDAIQGEDPLLYLEKMILHFINPNYRIPLAEVPVNSLHVLDLYRKSLLGLGRSKSTPKLLPLRPSTERKDEVGIVLSALKLHESGVEFSPTESLLDISFHRGNLKLPTIIVDDTTESALLNLMAFERVHVGAGNEVTSFVSFMDNLIDSAKDVSLLHSSGIIHNNIGSEKAVANLFNGLSKDMTPDPDGSVEKVYDQLDDYCKRQWNEWRANLMHTYFRNPWASLSLFAAIFLILLTTIQTFYTIVSYHHPG
ncbi:hypothetical protein AQUCO_02200017v1 [Aquilegia coerulea]|uniref:Uncharacterized protein n=1 Tax=Aquilegia coerulea TaxID=218851 RepID=A0A2G5DCR4_AQUCA|nr:hypothetical protein AQUCO_02200017v1 [Aquilegia coerulea]